MTRMSTVTLPLRDRSEAGRLLAEQLSTYANRSDVVVLALPRGGIPVGAALAKALHCDMHAFLVRKLGVPWQQELAMGAVASGGMRLINSAVAGTLHIPETVIESVVQRESQELMRRDRLYRRGRPLPNLCDKIAIVTDDGVATGSCMMLAVQAIRKLGAVCVLAAVPVAPPGAVAQLRQVANEVVCLAEPEEFNSVGEWYEDFRQLDDHEVCRLLDQHQEIGRRSLVA
jgi:putative phosphoribosyl transferase